MPVTPAQRAAAIGVFEGTTPSLQQLRDALIALYGDAYIAGALAASSQLPGVALSATLTGLVGTDDPTVAWDNWEPGNLDAALLADDGGLALLLDDAGITITGITDTTIDRLGSILADGALNGDSVDTIAAAMRDWLDSDSRAYIIANTELARAVNAASQARYAEMGVGQWVWLDSPGACPVCMDNAAGGPYPVGEGPDLPQHPSCRCSAAPVDPGSDADSVDESAVSVVEDSSELP